MKRDLKLNMDQLEETCKRIEFYAEAVTEMKEAPAVFLISISPCDRTQMMRVDRNDIWWNLQQILWELQEPESICHDDGSSYPDYKHNPMTRIFYSEEEWDAMMKEEEAERIKREANYRKMKSFRTQLRHSIETSIQREWESMNKIYRNAVVEFENTDDAYQRKIEQCYNEYSTYFDDIKDNAAEMKNFVRGAWQQIVDIAKLLNTINMLTTPYTMLMYYTGKLDSKREQSIRGVHEGVRLFLTDPLSALGAMGQNAMDTLDEEGLAYAAGYVSVDLVIGVGIKKGISKAFSKVDDIAEVGAKAAGKVDDVAEAGAKAANKVDDVIEGSGKTIQNIGELSNEQIEALVKYTGNDYVNINNSLRGIETLTPDNQAVVEAMKSALDNSTLPQNMTLYRGTSTEALGLLQNVSVDELVGKTFTEQGFMSTSVKNVVAESFQENMQITIEASKGAKALDISSISQYITEAEVLFDAGQEMLITSSEVKNGILYITVMLE